MSDKEKPEPALEREQLIQALVNKDFEEASRLLLSVLEQEPDNPLAWTNLGNTIVQTGGYADAVKCFRQALMLAPDMATAWYGLGTAYAKAQENGFAAQAFEQAIRNGLADSTAYYMLGLSLVRSGRTALAVPYLLTAKEKAPEDEEIAMQYALALANAGFSADAADAFREVLAMNPNHADALYNLGVLRVQSEDYTAARKLFEEALVKYPGHELAKKAIELLP